MVEETKPAVRQPDPLLDRLARVGTWLAASEAGAKDPTSLGMQAALRLYFCEQLGLPPLAASEVSVIKGRLYVGSKLLRALAAKQGYRVEPVESSDQSCTAVLKDGNGGKLGEYTFTIQDAERAKLIRAESAWQTHPARMLWARAAKFVLDDYAPEITLGLGTDDELAEIDGDAYELPDEPANPPEPVPVEPWESLEERRARLHRRLAVAIGKADTDAKILLPKGHENWEAYSRHLANEKFGVGSRADLTLEQLGELVRLVEEEMIPF